MTLWVTGCLVVEDSVSRATPAFDDPCPVRDFAAASHAVDFQGADSTSLAGQLDLPAGAPPYPAAVIIHHSGAVDRCAYDYMARLLVQAGFAVFRFDKRGTGQSDGDYGCCEDEDAVRAWAQAATLPEVDSERLFLIAQSRGTQIVADRIDEITSAQQPRGIVLLSSLLGGAELVRLPAPLLLILSDSEADLERIGPAAVDQYSGEIGGEIELYIAEGTEHTLFDISRGPIDWDDPAWRTRFHAGTANELVNWLKDYAVSTDQLISGVQQS
jgi:alpha/beta superfamily hydrolase